MPATACTLVAISWISPTLAGLMILAVGTLTAGSGKYGAVQREAAQSVVRLQPESDAFTGHGRKEASLHYPHQHFERTHGPSISPK